MSLKSNGQVHIVDMESAPVDVEAVARLGANDANPTIDLTSGDARGGCRILARGGSDMNN